MIGRGSRMPVIAAVVALATAAGCGRLGFDTGHPADAAPPDVVACIEVSHDEDADTVDDACDSCPQVAADQTDSDGDGVGDACDLAPTREQRVFFDPFTTPRSEWDYDMRVVFVGDAVQLPGLVTGVGITLRGTPGRTVLETGGRVLGAAATPRQIAVHAGQTFGLPDYYCELYDNGSLSLLLTYTLDGASYTNIAGVPLPGALDGGAFRIVFEHTPPNLRCIAYWQGVRYEISGTDPGGVTPETMFVSAFHVDAHLDYFVRLATP